MRKEKISLVIKENWKLLLPLAGLEHKESTIPQIEKYSKNFMPFYSTKRGYVLALKGLPHSGADACGFASLFSSRSERMQESNEKKEKCRKETKKKTIQMRDWSSLRPPREESWRRRKS